MFVLFLLFAYALGGMMSAVWVSRMMRLPDPRQGGSHNPGATNVLRLGGAKAAALVFIFDVLKGSVVIWLCQLLHASVWLIAASGVCVFLGHVYPLSQRFRGGKGVATSAGVLLAWGGETGVLVIMIWLITAAVTRYSSLAAVVAALVAPVVVVITLPGLPYLLAVSLISGVLLWRHRANLQRLRAGKESRIGAKSS